MKAIYTKKMKSWIDTIFALILLLLLSPILLIVSILLFFANNGDVLFVHQRPGKNQKIFKIIKFKTMNDNRDAKHNLLPDVDRLSKIGKFIRKTSLDELPQLLNVLKGDMSLIGPRPLLVQYLPLYNEFQKRRHEVKPGITGYAQVNGRNAINWQQKFEYDVWYIDNLTFLLDIKIFFKTFLKVFKSDGISSDSSATMEVFKGNN